MTIDAAGDRTRPIFLHGMWRSGSTFIWSRFRALSSACCFYEPLHHGLARLTAGRIKRDTPAVIAGNGHPQLSAPYFAEFEPLLKARGVEGYRRALAYHRFALEPGASNPDLDRYIGGLLEHADQMGKTAVLGFNRSGLRIGWLRQKFQAYDVLIERDPRQIWWSYVEQARRGNFFFLQKWLFVLECNAEHPLFAPIAERLPLRKGAQRFATDEKTYYRDALERMSPEQTYLMVFYMWLLLAVHALTHCDLVIDLERCADPAYRDRLTRRIGTATNLFVRFDDAAKAGALPDGLDRFDEIERRVLGMMPFKALASFADWTKVLFRLPELPPRLANLLADEWMGQATPASLRRRIG
ncbi:MAG: hypothetical protein ABIO39_03615 [Caulobacteraceae bacterium]